MATIVEAEIKLTAKKAIEQVKELKLELEDIKKTLKSNEQTQKKAEKSTKSFAKTLGTIGKAGGVIFLLQKAFELLKSAINSNQQVADGFAVVMGTINQVFTEIANVLVGVYNNITATTDGFDALGKVVSGIIDVALTPFKLIWDGIKLGLFEAQLAWEESFFGSGDTTTIDRLNESIKQTRQDIGETLDTGAEGLTNIVENFGEAVEEVGNAGSQVVEGVSKISIKSIADNVAANVQLKKSAERARIENQGLIEQYDRQAEQQRQIRDDDTKNINDRIAANDKLKTELEEQKKLMLENVNLMIQQAQAQFDLSGKEEDFLALQSAKNELKAVEAQIEGFMSEQKTNAVALEKELNELEISGLQNKAELQKIERDFKAEMIENDVLRLEQMQKNLKKEEDLEKKRLENKIKTFEDGTQAQQDAQHELDLFLKNSANAQTKLEKDLAVAKENQLKQTLGNIAGIVGQNSKFGKAIAVVQAIQDTFAGANKALAQGGLFGFIGAAAVIAAGIANVKNITSTQTPKPPASLGARSTGGESTPSVPAASAPSVPPSFSTVGASGVNQLADVLGNQPPPRAFVVSGDVTTAQQLDRNIVSSASIG
jgi:DNA repair exonuclease SbcCD ATPase subunit